MGGRPKVLFLGKADDPQCKVAADFLRANSDAIVIFGRWGDALPEEARWWQGDLLISYMARWVVPQDLIQRSSVALNFHPGSPEYPGVGCVNFALYERSATYGVTCHRIAPEVDSGEIVAVKRFAVYETDSVQSLLSRTYAHQLAMFYDVADRVLAGKAIGPCGEKWGRKPFSRRELNDLAIITPGMDAEEVARRARATSFGDWRPYLSVAGRKFVLA